MSRLSLLERYNKILLDEEIHSKDAISDKGALLTVIRGKRDICVIELTKKFIRKLEKYNLDVIPLRMMGQDSMYAIVHRNKEKAMELYNFVRSKGGYLRDDTPNEARLIGRLLEYFKEDVEEYIRRKYHVISNIPIRTDEPEDYDQLDENFQFKKISRLMRKLTTYYITFHWLIL